MEASIRAIVEAIHSSPTQAVLYLCGGASQGLGWLMSVPGASNTVLEALVPYSKMSLVQLLGKVLSSYCSRQTAEEMALLAYNRGLNLSSPGSPVIGMGFTSSLASSHTKRGDHRFHLSARTSDQLWTSTVTLSKLIANASKVRDTFASNMTQADVSEESEKHFTEDEELEQLISGQICFKVYPFGSGTQQSIEERRIILPGSFNPLHDGHLKLLEVATSICRNGYPCFEISAVNADKPPLSISQIKERVKQFEKVGKTVIISNQPFFYKKAELFPGSAFVIGLDTAARLLNPKYYDGNYNKMIEVLGCCKRTGCTFLVGGRNIDEDFKVREDLDVPEVLKDMFVSIPAEKFRVHISSTEIRESRGI